MFGSTPYEGAEFGTIPNCGGSILVLDDSLGDVTINLTNGGMYVRA